MRPDLDQQARRPHMGYRAQREGSADSGAPLADECPVVGGYYFLMLKSAEIEAIVASLTVTL